MIYYEEIVNRVIVNRGLRCHEDVLRINFNL